MAFGFWIFWIFVLLVDRSDLRIPCQRAADRNPVPNPGMFTNGTSSAFPARQTTLNQYFAQTGKHEGEGGCKAALAAEAKEFTAATLKQLANRGQPPPGDFGPSHAHPYIRPTPVQKRSFRRACTRALDLGHTWYKGRLMRLKDFPQTLIDRIQMRSQSRPRAVSTRPEHRQSSGHRRLRILQWNPGGMTQDKFLEYRQWLQPMQIDVAILSETRWSFDACWSDDKWTYIHTATEIPKTGGVLVMLSKKWVSPQQVGYQVDMPGRIIQVRAHFGKRATDIVAVYQFATATHADAQRHRAFFWESLNDCIARLPQRNQVICSGDFNCSISQLPSRCGSSGFQWHGRHCQGAQHKDMDVLRDIITRHGLTVLNTWNESDGPTFIHGNYASRIDFVLTRSHTCDGLAKQTQNLVDAAVLPVNSTHHIPILASIRKLNDFYQMPRAQRACNLAQRQQCRIAQLQDTQSWHQLNDRVCSTLHQIQGQAPDSEKLFRTLHEQVTTSFQTFFPGHSNALPKPNYDDFAHTTCTKWHHKKQILTFRSANKSLQTVFQVWYHWSQYCKKQKLQKTQARIARALRFRELCTDVQDAASRHDAHGMFKIINQYTPKKPSSKIRLRTPQGQIADQYETHAILVAFVRRTWQGPSALPKYDFQAPGVPFAADDIRRAIDQLHVNRSVAMPFLPAVAWKGESARLAQFLHQTLTTWWGTYPPIIPQDWRNAWLYFLPKPGKKSDTPEALRPIAFMETFGKLVMGLVSDCLKCHLTPMLRQQPQFGFLPMRGALDAVARVSQHYASIRTLVANHRRTVARQMTTTPSYRLVGGIQLFLDLTRAFDCVNRSFLIQHLHDLETPSDLLTIITHWHEQTHYNIFSAHETTSVPVGLGVRQGCKIAPQLWLVYMSKLIRMLTPLTGVSWIKSCLTLYADDIHAGCQFTSESELAWHLQCMGHLLDCIERLELQLSYQKSFLLLASTGSNHRRALQHVLKRTNTRTLVLIPRQGGRKTELPLHSQGRYLGTIMSYGLFEQQTWAHRKKAGWTAFHRLKCWLRQRQLHLKQRIYLWRTCINTILTYGLFAMNLNINTIMDYQSTVYQMMRMVIGDHAYLTRHTHQQALQHHAQPQPLELLQHMVVKQWRRHQRRPLILDDNDFLHNVQWTHLSETMSLLQRLQEHNPDVPIDVTAPIMAPVQVQYKCQYCHFTTHTIPNLRRHQTLTHQIIQYRTSPYTILDMSQNGKPQCNKCNKMFTTWR